MQNNLTTLHQQFQQKHNQLSKITDKIDAFMQHYKAKTGFNKQLYKSKMKNLRNQIVQLKYQFSVLEKDLVTYGQLPNDFIRMVIELPKLYDSFWETRQQQLMKKFNIKDEECKMLRQKLATNEQEYNLLRSKLDAKENKNSDPLPKQNEQTFNEQLFKPKRIVRKNQNIVKEQSDQFDSYLDKMEITIRQSIQQNDDPLFNKITQQGSQEEEDQDYRNIILNQSQNDYNTQRIHLNISSLDNTSEVLKTDQNCQNRKNSQPKFSSIKYRQSSSKNKKKCTNELDETFLKDKFWKDLSKHIKDGKNKGRKALSQSKENIKSIDNKQINKLSIAQRKVLTSKITDFRRMLFLEKGIQRFGFKA